MTRLNGWHRLWVVASGVWLILVTLGALKNFPTADEYRSRRTRFAQAEARTPELIECEEKARALENPYSALMACDLAATKDDKRYAEAIAKGEAAIREELPTAQLK